MRVHISSSAVLKFLIFNKNKISECWRKKIAPLCSVCMEWMVFNSIRGNLFVKYYNSIEVNGSRQILAPKITWRLASLVCGIHIWTTRHCFAACGLYLFAGRSGSLFYSPE